MRAKRAGSNPLIRGGAGGVEAFAPGLPLAVSFQPDVTQSDLAGVECDERRLGARVHAESLLDALDVPVNRVLNDGQQFADGPIVLALRNELQDLLLARGEFAT